MTIHNSIAVVIIIGYAAPTNARLNLVGIIGTWINAVNGSIAITIRA